MSFGPVIPVLRMLDETKAKAFYIDYLGFQIVFEHRYADGMPLYMGITRDGCSIHLSEHEGDCQLGSSIRISTVELDEYQLELANKHYENTHPKIEEMPWNSREMQLIDPFGNKITFSKSM